MSLCMMPLGGRWVKTEGRWVSVGENNVSTRTLYSNEREVIRNKCERKYLHRQKVSL